MWIYIITAFILVIALLFFIIMLYHSKLQEVLIKVITAEKDIDRLLNRRFSLLQNICRTFEDLTKDELFKDILELKIDKLTSFELNNKLNKATQKLKEVVDYKKDLVIDDDTYQSIKNLGKCSIECSASEKYYNENVEVYNKLITSFPTNLMAKFKHLEEKKQYRFKKEEIFEILKEK